MNFTELVAAVYLRLGVPSGDALLTSTIVGQAVNEALHEIDSEADWPWLDATETINTVAGTDAYTPAANWSRTRSLRIAADGYPMSRRTIDEVNDLWPFADQTSRPQVYAIEGGQLVVRPIPDGVYALEHRYVRTEADISGSSSPLMPAQFHPAIASLAAHIALGRSREDNRAAAALADFERWLRRMQKFRRRYQGPGRIRSRWDVWG